EYCDKIPAEKRSAIEAALKDTKAALESKDLAQIDAASAKLNEAWQAASQEMYQAQQQAAGAQGAPNGAGFDPNMGANPGAGAGSAQQGASDNGNVTDVPFEEVK
ncbi:MAG: molecular chaperone DnaK, partial [Bacteroidales bacterium]|nr:molecular chaperone DnaK [Bacteroidales bacterium]